MLEHSKHSFQTGHRGMLNNTFLTNAPVVGLQLARHIVLDQRQAEARVLGQHLNKAVERRAAGPVRATCATASTLACRKAAHVLAMWSTTAPLPILQHGGSRQPGTSWLCPGADLQDHQRR